MIYVSVYTECAGLLAKTLMDIDVSQYSLQEITIIFILELSANLLFLWSVKHQKRLQGVVFICLVSSNQQSQAQR